MKNKDGESLVFSGANVDAGTVECVNWSTGIDVVQMCICSLLIIFTYCIVIDIRKTYQIYQNSRNLIEVKPKQVIFPP